MNSVVILLLFYLTYITNASKLWDVDEIKIPSNDPKFCNVVNIKNPVICDPENVLKSDFKSRLNYYLVNKFPRSTPCLCKKHCSLLSTNNRMMIGVLVVPQIKIPDNCSPFYDCYARQVLEKWNIGACNGNSVLIMITNHKVHIFYGELVQARLPAICRRYIEKSASVFVSPVTTNFKGIFKRIIGYSRSPCLCNRTCERRHFKWLMNLTFFLGVVVIVTCIGGMSRRLLLAKMGASGPTRRTCASTSSSSIHVRRPTFQHAAPPAPYPTGAESDSPAEVIPVPPPDYNSIQPMPQPPPYPGSSAVPKTVTPQPAPSTASPASPVDPNPPPYSAKH